MPIIFKNLSTKGVLLSSALTLAACAAAPKQSVTTAEPQSISDPASALEAKNETSNFVTQSQETCSYENGRLFNDDFGNSICARGYRSAERNNHDVLLIFNFMTGDGIGESRRLTTCTTLSAYRIEKSYLCEVGKKYFFVAYYQRGNESGNRIWLEEIPAQQVAKRLKLNQEEYRENLKRIHGKFELKSNEFSRNKEFIDLIK